MKSSDILFICMSPFALAAFISAIIVTTRLSKEQFRARGFDHFFIKNYYKDDKIYTGALNILRISLILLVATPIIFLIFKTE